MTKKKDQESNFEASFSRLEAILEQLNTGEVSLDDSLNLYEEANGLIVSCSKKLNEAERKIEILIKDREGELSLDANQLPQTEDFQAPSGQQK